MIYENTDRLNRQGMLFVVFHTIIVFNLALNFGFFA